MIPLRSTFAAAAMLGATLGARLAFAQPPAEPPIPAELVQAMMVGPFGAAPQTSFIVGKLPPTWPAALVPPHAPTVGVVDNAYQGRIAIFQVAETPELVIPDFTAALRRAGGTPPPPRPQPGGFGASGLQPAPPAELCRADTLAVVTGAPRLTGGYVYVAMRTGPRAFECRVAASASRAVSGGAATVTLAEPRATALPRVPVPALRTPDGVQGLGSSSSGGLDRWDGQTRLRSGLRPAELLDLYALQLTQSGWTLGERIAGNALAAQVAERRDSTGVTWRATLTASAFGDSLQREMTLRIVDKARP